MNNFIDFKKDRNFDQVLQDGFNFLKYNFKSIIKYFWQLNTLWIILFVLFSLFYVYFTLNKFSTAFSDLNNGTIENPNRFDGVNLIYTFFIWFFTFRIYLTVFGYIHSYITNHGEVKIEDIQEFIEQKNFLKYAGLSIIISFMVILGLILLIIPGIWVLVPVSLMIPAFFLDTDSISEAIDKGFSYAKHNWWFSFGILLVMIIVILFISYLINLPIIIYGMSKTIIAIKDSNPDAITGIVKDPVIIFFSFLSTLLRYFLVLIQISIGTVLYYTVKERHTGVGSLEKLEQLKNENDL